MKAKWKEKKAFDKTLVITHLLLAVVAIVLCILGITGVWEDANYVVQPLMGVVFAIMALEEWREGQRVIAVFSLCVALFNFVVAAVVWWG